MLSWLKSLATALKLLDKLSDWLHDRGIRKNERKLIEKEKTDELVKDVGTAKRVRDELDNSDAADRVRKKFTRKPSE